MKNAKENDVVKNAYVHILGDSEVFRLVTDKIKMNTKQSNKKIKVSNKALKEKTSTIIVVVIVLIIAIAISNKMNSGTTDRWDNLTDEEQEWYEDNYGDGKMDDINDAIDDYKNN